MAIHRLHTFSKANGTPHFTKIKVSNIPIKPPNKTFIHQVKDLYFDFCRGCKTCTSTVLVSFGMTSLAYSLSSLVC